MSNTEHESAAARRDGSPGPERARMMRAVATASITGLFLLTALYILAWADVIVVPFAVAVTIGLTLAPLAQRMERHLPRYLVSAILLFGLLGILVGLFGALSIPAQQWSARLPEIETAIKILLTSFQGSFEKLDEISKTVEDARRTVEGGANAPDQPLDVSVQRFSLVTFVFSSVPVMVSQVIMFIGGFYFFTANRHRLIQGGLSLLRQPRYRRKMARITRDIEYFLSRYLAAITLVNIGLGVVTWLVMFALGMPSPELWGALAAILNFIPYLGPAVVTVVLAGVGLITFTPVSAALIPAGVYICLNIIESQFVTPAVVGNRLSLNPFLVFFSLALWAWIWGPIGAFLAVPLLIMIVVAGMHLLVHEPRGGPATFGKPAAANGNGWGWITVRSFLVR